MIYGKREWIRRIPVKIAVGIKDNEFYFGPEDTVRKKTSNYVMISPGNIPANELALKIIEKFKSDIEPAKIERIVPYGRGELYK